MSPPRSIDALNATPSYTVHEVGDGARDQHGRPTSGRSTAPRNEADVVAEIADGRHRHHRGRAQHPAVRRPAHRRRARARDRRRSPPLQVMACENAINATDLLRDRGLEELAGDERDALVDARGLRQHRRRPHRARRRPRTPASTSRSRRSSSGRSSARPFGGDAAGDPGRALRRRPRALHRAQALHRQHRSRHDRVPRLRCRGSDDLRRAARSRGRSPRCARCSRRRSALLVAKHGFDAGGAAGLRREDPRAASPTRTCPTPSERVGRSAAAQAQPARALRRPGAELAERGHARRSRCSADRRRAAVRRRRATSRASRCSRLLRSLTAEEFTAQVTGLVPETPCSRMSQPSSAPSSPDPDPRAEVARRPIIDSRLAECASIA